MRLGLFLAITVLFSLSAFARMQDERDVWLNGRAPKKRLLQPVKVPPKKVPPKSASASVQEPAIGYKAFLGPQSSDDKRRALAEAGYVNQSGFDPNKISDERYGKNADAAGNIESVLVKRDPNSGDVIQIIQTIENTQTGSLVTNMIDYNEKSTSHCSNVNASTGKPGATTQCSTLSSTLCARFSNQQAQQEIMPLHYREMSTQLRLIKKVSVGIRDTANKLQNSEQQRCNTLAANLDVDRSPGTLTRIDELPSMTTDAPAPAVPETPTVSTPKPPSIWGAK